MKTKRGNSNRMHINFVFEDEWNYHRRVGWKQPEEKQMCSLLLLEPTEYSGASPHHNQFLHLLIIPWNNLWPIIQMMSGKRGVKRADDGEHQLNTWSDVNWMWIDDNKSRTNHHLHPQTLIMLIIHSSSSHFLPLILLFPLIALTSLSLPLSFWNWLIPSLSKSSFRIR